MQTALEIKGYLLFLLMVGLAFVCVTLLAYVFAIIQVVTFVFSVLSLGVGSG